MVNYIISHIGRVRANINEHLFLTLSKMHISTEIHKKLLKNLFKIVFAKAVVHL